MAFVKAKFGLLEQDNFFLTSPSIDLIGEGAWHRTQDLFVLTSGTVMRRLPYDQFVIDIEAGSGDTFTFFLQDDVTHLGIAVDAGVEYDNFRLTYFDCFLQTFYSTDNGQTWVNIGGRHLDIEGELLQGFELTGDSDLLLTDYTVYRAPHVTLQNWPPGTFARLTDEHGSSLERYFDENFECHFFLDRNIEGIVEIYEQNTDQEPVFTSEPMDITIGDVFIFSSETIQLIYEGRVLDYTVTSLPTLLENFKVKNIGAETAHDVIIISVSLQNDIIEFQYQGGEWLGTLQLGSLEPEEEKPFRLRIRRNFESGLEFGLRYFDLIIY